MDSLTFRSTAPSVRAQPCGNAKSILTDSQSFARNWDRIPVNCEKRGLGGSDLGLVISKGLVEARGVGIKAESPGLGLGSRFTFTIPAAKEGSGVSASVVPRSGSRSRRNPPFRGSSARVDASIRSAGTDRPLVSPSKIPHSAHGPVSVHGFPTRSSRLSSRRSFGFRGRVGWSGGGEGWREPCIW